MQQKHLPKNRLRKPIIVKCVTGSQNTAIIGIFPGNKYMVFSIFRDDRIYFLLDILSLVAKHQSFIKP